MKQQSSDNRVSITRRNFIQKSAILGGTLAFSGTMSSFISLSKEPLKVNGLVNKIVFSEGWKIKPIETVKTLDASFFVGNSNTDKAAGWMQLPSAPAMPHEILLHHKKIEEPWKPFGIEKCFWVSEKDWVYSLDFSVKNLSGEKRLIFKEMKGKVDVYLNGIKIASHADQSQPLVVDVTGKLKPENGLVLHFSKAAPDAKPDGKDISKRAEMGNYLGPNPMIYTSGIVGDVILEHTDGSLMNEIITDFSLNQSFTQGNVSFKISGKSRLKTVRVQVKLVAPDGKTAAEKTLTVETENGFFKVNPEVTVSNPELWWPRGYGEQKLYKAEILLSVNGAVHQIETRTITISLL